MYIPTEAERAGILAWLGARTALDWLIILVGLFGAVFLAHFVGWDAAVWSWWTGYAPGYGPGPGPLRST